MNLFFNCFVLQRDSEYGTHVYVRFYDHIAISFFTDEEDINKILIEVEKCYDDLKKRG